MINFSLPPLSFRGTTVTRNLKKRFISLARYFCRKQLKSVLLLILLQNGLITQHLIPEVPGKSCNYKIPRYRSE